ncbi:MAG: methylglyoxal synthase [Flavobacteriales bacterium]|jgi:methylglyoxal synthase
MEWKELIEWFSSDAVRSVLGNPRVFRQGSILLHANEQVNGVFVLIRGDISAQLSHGGMLALEAPTCVGELGFLGQNPAIATVECKSEVEAYFIDRGCLFALSELDHRKAMELMLMLSKMALERWGGRYHDRYIALVAHDEKKAELVDFVRRHREFFTGHNLIATQTTGKRLSGELGITIARTTLSGPMGGDQEIGGLVSNGLIEAVFFFRDPAWSAPHLSDVNALVRICEVHNVPIATNVATAELMLAR